jgi:hypothetical protein
MDDLLSIPQKASACILFSSRRIARRLGRHLLFRVNGTFVSEFSAVNSPGVGPIIFDHREVFDAL